MKWKRAVAVLLLCGLLQGCGLAPSFADPERSAGKIVLQVSVEAMPADTAWDRVYTEPVKIEAILDYIQALPSTYSAARMFSAVVSRASRPLKSVVDAK